MPQAAQEVQLEDGALVELDVPALAVAVRSVMAYEARNGRKLTAHHVAVGAGVQDRTIHGLLSGTQPTLSHNSWLAIMRWLGLIPPGFTRDREAAA
jgi:hypothetical protein